MTDIKTNPDADDQFLAEGFASGMFTREAFVRRVALLKQFIFSELFTKHEEKRQHDIPAQVKEFRVSYGETAYDKECEERDGEWLQGLGKAFFERFTPQNANELLASIERYGERAPLITLTTAFRASDEQQEEIGRWVKKNFGKSAMYDMRTDPELIGGCTVSYKGFFKDYSLRSTIESQKEVIAARLKEFVHGLQNP